MLGTVAPRTFLIPISLVFRSAVKLTKPNSPKVEIIMEMMVAMSIK